MTTEAAARGALLRLADLHGTGAPFYARLAALAADHPATVALLAALPPARWSGGAHLVNALQFTGRTELAAHWPGIDPPTTVAVSLKALLNKRFTELTAAVTGRDTQVNDVTTAPVLRWLWGTVAVRAGWDRVAVLDLGSGAGVLTTADSYAAHYLSPTGGWELPGGRGPLTVATSGPVPPVPAPAVIWRRGIDLRPPPVTDPDRRWLCCCLPADHTDRVALLAAALTGPARWHLTGDVVALLPAQVAAAPAEAGLILQSVGLINHLSEAQRTLLTVRLAAAGSGRDLAWVGVEPHRRAIAGMLAALGCPLPAAVAEAPDGPSADPLVFAMLFRGGIPVTVALGTSARSPRTLDAIALP